LTLEGLDGPAADAVAMALIEVGRAEFAVGGLAGEQVVGGDKDGMSDGNHGLVMAALAGDAAIAGGEGGAGRLPGGGGGGRA
jgi:hypothetical protein